MGIVLCLVVLVGGCTSRQNDPAYAHLSSIYQKAHEAQDSAYYPQAIALYKQCISYCSSPQYEKSDSVKLLIPKAMVQLVNTYQSASMPRECILCFDSLSLIANKQPKSILSQNFKRDIYVLLAYSMSRTDAEEKAVHTMDSALAMPLSYPSPERRFRDYAYAAGVYYCVPSSQDRVLKYGRLALDEMKRCQNKSGAQWLVALMAKQYQDKGDIGKAIAMCREGYQLAELCKDTLGMANSKKELANYLYQWKLYDYANKYISEAISLIEKTSNSNPMVTIVAYTIKAKTLIQKGQLQEAQACLQKASLAGKGLPYNSGLSDIDLWKGKILINDTTESQQASYLQGIKLLSKVSRKGTNGLRAQTYYELAKANIKKGNGTKGGVFLDSMYAILNATSTPTMIEGAYDFALNYYLNKGDKDNIIRYSAAINQQRIATEKTGAIKDVARSLARFEMDKQEDEMEKKLEEMELRKVLEVIGVMGACIIIMGGLFLYFTNRRKKQHQKNAKTEQKLSEVQNVLTQMSSEKRKVEKELKKIEKKDLDKVKAGVSLQQLLDMKGDKKFKDYFNQAYPHFVANLRKQIPHITKKEELYSMLIALHCNNEELGETFHITRKSVIMAKYRIRKKLNLPEGESIEDYMTNELEKAKEAL